MHMTGLVPTRTVFGEREAGMVQCCRIVPVSIGKEKSMGTC